MTKKKNKKASSSSSSLSLSSSSSSSSSSLLSSSSTTSSSEQMSQSLISLSSSDENKRIKLLNDESYKRIKREVFLVVDSEMNTVKINKKYKIIGAEIIKILQRRHWSCHRVNNIGNQGPKAVINDKKEKKEESSRFYDIRSYHLEEWEETDEGTTVTARTVAASTSVAPSGIKYKRSTY
ncbi:hypothetical protein Glove_219g77 [Diversispora epigaea]|uniref:Uncharacterized protein n=1 Tax=Diversispora epigaea TaxID=1348612 RepID=A0A397IM84_9GLOM|nr:hypothetical protein Glove_219g77 [Diversispora epigaea]